MKKKEKQHGQTSEKEKGVKKGEKFKMIKKLKFMGIKKTKIDQDIKDVEQYYEIIKIKK